MKCKIGIWSVFAFIRPLPSSSSRGRGEDRRMYANFELCTVWMRSTIFNTQYWTARDSTLNSEAMLFMKLKLKPIQFTAYWIIAITGKMKEFSIHLHIAEVAAATTTTTTKDGKQKYPIFLLIHLFIWHTQKKFRQSMPTTFYNIVLCIAHLPSTYQFKRYWYTSFFPQHHFIQYILHQANGTYNQWKLWNGST